MNSTESGKFKLINNIVEGLKQKPAYLLLFGNLVVFMIIVCIFAGRRQTDQLVVIGSYVVILVAMVLAVHVIKIVEVRGRIPQGDREVMEQLLALGTKDDIPLKEKKAKKWAKRWNCRWTYMSESGQLLPYVDDNITIDLKKIDQQTGLVRCWDDSPHRGGTKFELFGRISNRDMALLFYRGEEEDFEDFIGVIILRMLTSRVHGWWLGIGKDKTEIGGRFTWKQPEDDPDFQPKAYDISKDPPMR